MKFEQKLHFHLLLLLVLLGLQRVTAGLLVTRVKAGNTAFLKCPHDKGNNLVMVTWKIQHLNYSQCYISYLPPSSLSPNQTFSNCSSRIQQDVGFTMVNLTIENSTISDEGKYTCEVVNDQGVTMHSTTLQVLVKPLVLIKPSRLRSAECYAIGGNPAARIEWNSTSLCQVNNTTFIEYNRTKTVVSTYTAKEESDTQAMCIVHHPTFRHPEILSVSIPAAGIAEAKSLWWVSLPAAAIIVLAVVIILLWQRSNLRTLFGVKKEDNSGLTENPTAMVEDVEPYASFTQKVNSIYNSTNELSEAKEKNLEADYGFNKIPL